MTQDARANGGDAQQRERAEQRSQLFLWLGSLVVAALLFFVALRFVGPPPPKRLVLASGPADGLYRAYASEYADQLAKDGIQVEIRETAGSVENLALLSEGDVDLAFVQGGTASDVQKAELGSLGSVFLEPLWIFHRRNVDLTDLGNLAHRRIAVGPQGSGTRWLALRLLEANGVSPGVPAGTEVLPLGGHTAADGLLSGTIDAAFFVVGAEAPYLPALLASPDVALYSVARHEAYVRRYRFLASVLLPEGVLDLDANVPDRDERLIAPTAALVGGPELHSAIVALVIDAARRVHGPGTLLSEPGSFPSPHQVDVPLSDNARRHYEHGPSWLYRVFPFWLASFLDRAVILLLPLITLLFPLFKTAPPLYRWALRRRIYRWYGDVRKADRNTGPDATTETLDAELARLDAIEGEVANVSIPLSYMSEFYHLRQHLDFIRRRLQTLRDEREA